MLLTYSIYYSILLQNKYLSFFLLRASMNSFENKNIQILIPVKKVILLDQDMVLADLHIALYAEFKRRYADLLIGDPESQEEFYMTDQYPLYRDKIYDICHTKNFFATLPPIEGAIESVRRIIKRGHEAVLCTTPIDEAKYCRSDKEKWKNEYLGKNVPIHFAHDKTHHRGNIIIDDNPKLKGEFLHTKPWEHVIYDQPYNRKVEGQRRINWGNYEEVLHELEL